jgi:hypothetical protein
MTVQDAAAELNNLLAPPRPYCIPRVECADGFSMSVQASNGHYCTPRDSIGPWNTVEVGYPTQAVESFLPYIDGSADAPTDTVYGYVPIELVAQAIIDHGGFKAGA